MCSPQKLCVRGSCTATKSHSLKSPLDLRETFICTGMGTLHFLFKGKDSNSLVSLFLNSLISPC